MILLLILLICNVNSLYVITPSSYKYLTRLSCKGDHMDEHIKKAFDNLVNGLDKIKDENKGLNLTQIRNVLNETIIHTKYSKNQLQESNDNSENDENPYWYEY